MNGLAATQTYRSPLLTGIRRAEAMVLGALAVASVIVFGPIGTPFAFALLATAAVLLPRCTETAVPGGREEQRLDVARELLGEGRTLRARYERRRMRSGFRSETRDLLALRFEIIEWISSSRARLAHYPEFAGIYDAHHGTDLLEEFDGRLQRLAEIERLAISSQRLRLPI